MIDKRPYSPPQVVSHSSAISVEKQRRITELRAEGLTLVVISERLGLHLNTVHKYCGKLGLIPRRECGCATRGRPIAPDCRCHAPDPAANRKRRSRVGEQGEVELADAYVRYYRNSRRPR